MLSSQMPFDLFYQTFCSIWIWSKLHNQGKWPGKHLEEAERKQSPRDDPGFRVWVREGLSLPWRQMLGISWEGMGPVRKERASHCFLIQQDVRKSKAVSQFSSPVLAPFHKLMAKAQREVLLMHASGSRHWSVATVQPQTLPVNSQSRLMSKLTHNV